MTLRGILNRARMARWHLGRTIPSILRHPPVYPESPRKPALRRLLDNLYIYLRDGSPCVAYDAFGLDAKDAPRLGDFVAQYAWIRRLCKSLDRASGCSSPFARVVVAGDTQVPLLQDKYLFWSYLDRHGIKTVPVLAHTLGGKLYDFSAGGLAKEERFFAKPAAELCGAGTMMVAVRDGRFYDGSRPLDLEKLAAEGDFVFQPVVENHADLKAFNPSSLNTLRMVTCRTPGGAFELWDPGMLRIGRAGSAVDNFAKGGIGVGIDGDGRLMRFGYSHDPDWRFRKMEAHPDSGLRFLGKAVPFYREAAGLALAAHRLFPSLRTVGWDVAVEPGGPVLLEGNHNWDMEMLQIVHRKGAAERFREIFGK